jgi:membrane protein
MVAFAAAGFAMGSRPDLVERLKNEITAAWPGALGDTLNSVVNQAISSAVTVGFFDLLALLGLGLALAVTFALTGLLPGFAGTVLAFLGLAQQAWAEMLTPLGADRLAANRLIFTCTGSRASGCPA